MMTRVRGRLESVSEHSVVIAPAGLGIAFEVLVPACTLPNLQARVGEDVELHTLAMLDSPNQGSTFVPKLLGFASVADRSFFELLTSVRGLGSRKCLRALAIPAADVAAAIAAHDAKTLQKLPEIGKRMAETIIATLDGKVAAYVSFDEATRVKPGRGAGIGRGSGPERDAVDALIALGEQAELAQARVGEAFAGLDAEAQAAVTTDALLDAVFARSRQG